MDHSSFSGIFKFIKKDGIFIHTYCEGELLSKFEVTSNDIVGKTLYDFFPKEIADKKQILYLQAWEGKSTHYEIKMGNIHYAAILIPECQEEKVIEVTSYCIDLSDRKNIISESAWKENLYETVLNTMSDGVFVLDKGKKIFPLNNNANKVLCHPNSANVKRKIPISSLEVEFLDDHGQPIPLEKFPGLMTIEKGIPINNAVFGVKKEGRITRWVSTNSHPLKITENNEIAGLLSFHDITLQKEQEIKLNELNSFQKHLLDILENGIIATDSNGKITLLNKSAHRMFGLKNSIESYIGLEITGIHSYFGEKTILDIANNRKKVTKEIQIDSGKIIECNYFPFQTNCFKGDLWEFLDGTEQRKMEQEIIHAMEEAEKANIAKSNFLSKISHELRTPLNGILGFAQLLEIDDTLDNQQLEFVNEILHNGRHLLNLINDLLDISRIETGNFNISIDTINIQNIANECVSIIQPLADQKKVKIHNHVENSCVLADPIRLKQIFINLLDNAIKYNRENGEVIISSVREERELTIHVKDTGKGFLAKEYHKIFKPFYRIEGSTENGAGMGLSLVKQLVELMGGKIGVSSILGIGSDFYIKIPLSKNNNELPTINQKTNHDILDIKTKISLNALYIEDNQSNLKLVKKILESINMNVFSATNGAEGLKMASEKMPDLILLDINLPDISGYQVFEVLKSNGLTNKIPVIALSASAMEKDMLLAKEKGFSGYLTKPLEVNELLDMINDILRKKLDYGV